MQTFLRYCIGLDISKDTLQVCLSVIDSTGRVTVKATTKVANTPKGFITLIDWVGRHRKLDLPLTYLMESTGVYHEAVAWHLHQQDQSVSILLPNKAKYYFKSLGYKSKNDKIDAQGLSRMGLQQQVPVWKPLSKNLYALRLLTRQHQRLQELKTQSTNQQHALAHSAFESRFIDKQLTKLVAFYDAQIGALETAINELIEQDPVLKPRVERLVAIKGLALLSVAVLVAETNGFEGFSNQRHLVSYAGYDVVENQSGNHSGKTRISKKGNSRLRRILHMPAFNAVRFNEPTCKALYDRVYERGGIKMKAYVAVQKRLLLMAYALWRHGVKYDPEYLANQASKDKKIVPTGGTTARAAPTGSTGRSRVVLLVVQRYEKNPIPKFAFHDSTSRLSKSRLLATHPKLTSRMEFHYFIGIDIAKDTLDWAVYTQQDAQLSTHTPNTLAGIKTALVEFKALPGWSSKQAVFCMEHTAQAALRHL